MLHCIWSISEVTSGRQIMRQLKCAPHTASANHIWQVSVELIVSNLKTEKKRKNIRNFRLKVTPLRYVITFTSQGKSTHAKPRWSADVQWFSPLSLCNSINPTSCCSSDGFCCVSMHFTDDLMAILKALEKARMETLTALKTSTHYSLLALRGKKEEGEMCFPTRWNDGYFTALIQMSKYVHQQEQI